MKGIAVLACAAAIAAALTRPSAAQPVQLPPVTSAPVSALLARAPAITLSNGLVTARIARIDAARGFYNGTRFDQAGVVTSLTVGGKEFYGTWFDRTAPGVLDYTYVGDDIVAGPDSAISGPVEEFAPLDYKAKPGTFVKIGVGVLYQPDTQVYDHYRHYRILDAGQRTTSVTKTSVMFRQVLSNDGTGFIYEKSLRLVPGKPQLLIEHRLKNTGTRAISTNVYDHNFTKLVPGNGDVTVTFHFAPAAANPPPADLIRIQANSLTYLRPMANKERVSFLITGFGKAVTDYDFTVKDADASVRIQGDQAVTRMDIFSIDRVQSIEPYITLDLAPGAAKSWTYTYTFASGNKWPGK